MTTGKESNEPKFGDLDDAVLSYWDGVKKVIGKESEKLKERVEQDSKQILARAKEEAQRTVDQAKQEARLESERIIARSKEEAERLAREYREEAYNEALKESSRVISSINEKVSKIITEITERSLEQLKDDFARVSSESRSELENRTTQILTRTRESVEGNIGEIKTKINNKSKSSFTITAEPEKEIPPRTEPDYEKGEVILRQTTKEAATPIASVFEETDSGIYPVPDKLDIQIENNDSRLFQGRIKVEIVCPPYKEDSWSMQDELARVPGLKVISTDNYIRGNSRIMVNIIELEQPMPLLETIKSTMRIEDVAESEGYIVVKPH